MEKEEEELFRHCTLCTAHLVGTTRWKMENGIQDTQSKNVNKESYHVQNFFNKNRNLFHFFIRFMFVGQISLK